MLDRLQFFIEQHGLIPNGSKTLIGLSGGLDSVFLLRALHDLNYEIAAAHVNYRLRGAESDGDAAFCMELCQQLNIPFFEYVVSPNEIAGSKGSVQMIAREIRYRFFDECATAEGFDQIAIATHSDDNIETFFLNLLRGSGLTGLAGIKWKRGKVVRPMLFLSKSEIEKEVQIKGWDYRNDSSNDQLKYQRNKIRKLVIPALEQVNPGARNHIAANMQHLSDYEFLLEGLVREWKNEHVTWHDDELHISLPGLKKFSYPGFLLFELIREYGFNLAQCNDLMNSGRIGATVESEGHIGVYDRGSIIIKAKSGIPAPDGVVQRGTNAILSPIPIAFRELKSVSVVFARNPAQACFDMDKLKFPLHIRKWLPGDRFRPFGMKGFKKISDFLVDEKVPITRKEEVYVLESDNQICWVIGYRIDDRFRVSADTKGVLMAELKS